MSHALTSTCTFSIVFFGYVDPTEIEWWFQMELSYFTTYIVASAFFISLKSAFNPSANAAESDKRDL